MTATRDEILAQLDRIVVPGGGTLVSRDLVRALRIDGGKVGFVIEAPDAEAAQALTAVRGQAEAALAALPGVTAVQVALTAPAAPPPAPSSLKIGRHPTPQDGPAPVQGVDRIIAVGSGKGGVGKSTVAANLAVALARRGRRVGLLDADIYGPSVPKIMGINQRPSSPDGKQIIPLKAHGVTLMSIGFMLPEDEAVIWRGPMLMGALQQMLGQVIWGRLDALVVDMPPGTGDVHLTLCSKSRVTGAIVVSTPQDLALLDARKALAAFDRLNTPVLGLVENMATHVCSACGHEDDIFGDGGVEAEAARLGLPFLGKLPLNRAVRLAGDGGVPVAATESVVAQPFFALADRLIAGGMA